jgi:F0F1-type ATP synthase membrane subunit c/vacuolar-type H+-ATPase subunit K
MRALKIVCGIAVIVMALHFGHAIHHFHSHAARDGLHGIALWGSMSLGVVTGILSLIGGLLLFTRN